MDLLILGGTQWLGRELAAAAVARGHDVTCLARGEAGAVADGVRFVASDRSSPDAYAAVAGRAWDAVIDVTRVAAFAAEAAAALAGATRQAVFISTGNVYARHDEPGADETAALLEPGTRASDDDPYGTAKVACEAAYRAAYGDRLLVVRSGLIGGPGDHSGRTGYYVARAARDDAPMLVPDLGDAAAQLIDVRDLVDWVLGSLERGLTGTFDAVGERNTVAGVVASSLEVAGRRGEVVAVPAAFLVEQGVAEWSGEDSMPLWIADASWSAFQAHSNAAAVAAGLRLRPLEETLADLLAWERAQGLDRARGAGLSAGRERDLVRAARDGARLAT
ncbi:NAD-dependent epimerase/dehydratase family protein [Agromyces sp. MMS24-K17]|uniref:NAD-dependent epimerase/dehydratase family protein n=1 Tax=Agromyces sp. MMS24-K17 TaxID=3372850 RepID=UPI003753EC71